MVEQVFEVVSELVVFNSSDTGVSQAEQNRQRLGKQLEGLLHKVSAPHVLCCMFGLLLQVINDRFIFLMVPSQRSASHVSNNLTHCMQLPVLSSDDIMHNVLYSACLPRAIPSAFNSRSSCSKQA